MKRNKILFVNPYESSLFFFRKELLDSLIESGYEVVLCINNTKRVDEEYSDKVFKIIDVKMNLKDKSIISNIKLKKQYKAIIEQEKPDIILSFGIKPNLYCGIASGNTPIIANITGLGNIFSKKNLLFSIGLHLYKRSFKHIDCVFFQNEDEKTFFEKYHIPFKKYEVIPGSGVNLSKFSYKKSDHSSKRTKFLFASRAIKEKGFDLLLDAIPYVIANNPKAYFTIVSSEEDVFQMKKAVDLACNSGGQVQIIKKTEEMKNLYYEHDFIVSPSYYKEGTSNILLESLSCGRPIITTNDNPGCMELLAEGLDGFGVKSNDLNSLVDALTKACLANKDQIDIMGAHGRKLVEDKYDRNIVISKYLEIIKHFLG